MITRAMLWAGLGLALVTAPSAAGEGPYQATGFKVGEVSDSTAIVWVRLTQRETRNPSDGPMVELSQAGKKKSKKDKGGKWTIRYPEGVTVADIRDAVPGTAGQARVLYKREDGTTWRETDWHAVDPARDFTHQFRLKDLAANGSYLLRVESRGGAEGPAGQSLEGRFRTAPAGDTEAKVVFTVSTGQAYGDRDAPGGYKIYARMLALRPDFFVHTGDILYYDRLAKNEALARYHWQRMYSLPTNVAFHCQVAAYFIKDDHDTWQNDCWPTMGNTKMGEFTFEQGLRIFPEQVPMGEKTYRTRRWGKDLQIWMVEGRDFRSANTDPDGPAKTIWGAEQKAWLKRTVAASDARFRILISPTPIVGPDRTNKKDNHANKGFTHEGDEVRAFLAGQKNMVVICGDRHWQYVSVHPKTGVREYSCGPASDGHAGGWSDDMFYKDYHKYLKVIGGFLSVTVERRDGVPTMICRHHGVDGQIYHEDTQVAK